MKNIAKKSGCCVCYTYVSRKPNSCSLLYFLLIFVSCEKTIMKLYICLVSVLCVAIAHDFPDAVFEHAAAPRGKHQPTFYEAPRPA